MKAIKDNKSYTIFEQQKEAYLKQGYDIYDDQGNRLEVSPLKKITYQEHLNIIKSLQDEVVDPALPDTVLEMLQLYAKEKGIDTGSATSESGILTKIIEAEKV